jgi:hypothetical protein
MCEQTRAEVMSECEFAAPLVVILKGVDMNGNLATGHTACAWTGSRRDFFKGPCLVAAGLSVAGLPACSGTQAPGKSARFGIVTDAHYADSEPRGTRQYRRSLDKMAECVALMNAERVDFLIELGDLKDQNEPPDEKNTLAYLEAIEEVFGQFNGPRYHVLGNHDVDSISKAQFLDRVENTGVTGASGHYAFDVGGIHGVVLDANHTADGVPYDRGQFKWTDTNIPPEQLAWLRDDLAAASGPSVVFVHQLLDGEGDHCVNNASDVRQVLEESGNVLAVFQGHYHPGQINHIGSIPYYTLPAMVEGGEGADNAYAIVEVSSDRRVSVIGHRKATTAEL